MEAEGLVVEGGAGGLGLALLLAVALERGRRLLHESGMEGGEWGERGWCGEPASPATGAGRRSAFGCIGFVLRGSPLNQVDDFGAGLVLFNVTVETKVEGRGCVGPR